MTTRTTPVIQAPAPGQGLRRVLGMTAVSVVVLIGAAVGMTRAGSDAPAVTAPAAITRPAREGVAPRGGMAERMDDHSREQAAALALTITTRGGLGEQYAEQQQAAVTAAAGTAGHMGGMAELYRDQAAAQGKG